MFHLVRGSVYFFLLVHRSCDHVYIHCAYVDVCLLHTQRYLDGFCLKCFRNAGCQSLLTIKSLLAKFFKSLYYDRFYCIQQVNMS